VTARSVRTRVAAALIAAWSVAGSGIVAAGSAPSAPSSPAPAATPVIMVRGYAGSPECPGTDVTHAYWGGAVLKLADAGWRGPLLPVSYYACDGDGVDITGYGRKAPAGATATITPGAPRAGYTSDTPPRRIAHDLAWFVYDEFAATGTPVDLVGFSMGGLLIRYALYRVGVGDPAFPPFLYVPRVVTVATPHAGLQPGTVRSTCGTTTQCRAMAGGSAFMTDLAAHGRHPQARGGTAWTVVGSSRGCDIVPGWSALAMRAATRVRYVHPCYGHGDYLWDYTDDLNATMRVRAPGDSAAVAVQDAPHLLLWLTRVLRH
jgi:hypothetical protein